MNIDVVMLAGDNVNTCTAAGDKEREIRRVVGGAQEGGQVGDGINDALSLEAVGDK
ncbi:MAG: hypothetical protein LBS77_04950 [Desulfovibrio sp.]|jgi:cation transport ATPase|nr:hypothetical protein [Desulfovibrio sp.]